MESDVEFVVTGYLTVMTGKNIIWFNYINLLFNLLAYIQLNYALLINSGQMNQDVLINPFAVRII